ncbi:hypothetical protein AF72_03565 [Xylella taiwanensis]|uniref:Uncharacterized protein n=1 Tax=Xylella taiwanensis TaxID=1444770 RepID=Z9JKG3_9GAMM|nr:hypothetical protein AB672_03285 [Xylella taiwanensis]EWS78654.1 hypothetical protein AF72_03565 [Xylella taiwanensis]
MTLIAYKVSSPFPRACVFSTASRIILTHVTTPIQAQRLQWTGNSGVCGRLPWTNQNGSKSIGTMVRKRSHKTDGSMRRYGFHMGGRSAYLCQTSDKSTVLSVVVTLQVRLAS